MARSGRPCSSQRVPRSKASPQRYLPPLIEGAGSATMAAAAATASAAASRVRGWRAAKARTISSSTTAASSAAAGIR